MFIGKIYPLFKDAGDITLTCAPPMSFFCHLLLDQQNILMNQHQAVDQLKELPASPTPTSYIL
jgi:hypothetical protein